MSAFSDELKALKAQQADVQAQLDALPVSQKDGQEWKRLQKQLYNLDVAIAAHKADDEERHEAADEDGNE
jgi:hypothetical protein